MIDLFTKHNGYNIMKMIHDDLHPKKHVSYMHLNSDGETSVRLDDVAHVVEQFKHENESNVNIHRMTINDPWLNKLVRNGSFIGQTDNPNPNLQGRFLLKVKDPDDEQMQIDHNKLLAFCGRDVSQGKCAGLKVKKPKTVDDDECETSKHGSKKSNGRKALNEILSKAVKER
uniref:Uncharacterized protein n=1 Tax=Tanacetum cinerariifolium TaxID=118510 RepID=A0A699HGI5_TANCI|nr:hypothetical protein [Tanacetum cinerariifolium]